MVLSRSLIEVSDAKNCPRQLDPFCKAVKLTYNRMSIIIERIAKVIIIIVLLFTQINIAKLIIL